MFQIFFFFLIFSSDCELKACVCFRSLTKSEDSGYKQQTAFFRSKEMTSRYYHFQEQHPLVGGESCMCPTIGYFKGTRFTFHSQKTKKVQPLLTGIEKVSPLPEKYHFPSNVKQQKIQNCSKRQIEYKILVALNSWETMDMPFGNKFKSQGRDKAAGNKKYWQFSLLITGHKSPIGSGFSFNYGHEVACMPFYWKQRTKQRGNTFNHDYTKTMSDQYSMQHHSA